MPAKGQRIVFAGGAEKGLPRHPLTQGGEKNAALEFLRSEFRNFDLPLGTSDDFRDIVPTVQSHGVCGEMVGAERFELSTSWSQTRRSTRLSYTPNEEGENDSGFKPLSTYL